jgi:hypothetical protein
MHPPEGIEGVIDRAEVAFYTITWKAPVLILEIEERLKNIRFRFCTIKDIAQPSPFDIGSIFLDEVDGFSYVQCSPSFFRLLASGRGPF